MSERKINVDFLRQRIRDLGGASYISRVVRTTQITNVISNATKNNNLSNRTISRTALCLGTTPSMLIRGWGVAPTTQVDVAINGSNPSPETIAIARGLWSDHIGHVVFSCGMKSHTKEWDSHRLDLVNKNNQSLRLDTTCLRVDKGYSLWRNCHDDFHFKTYMSRGRVRSNDLYSIEHTMGQLIVTRKVLCQ